jgi:demethylmenaquinone methyltransferase/2-methoxy-6-polyprenyl-1,4-benzoquinol methylase
MDTSQREREQIAYYRARAAEYDEWFLRQGRYDRGSERNGTWFAEVEQVRAELRRLDGLGDVLEIASGTGLWTEQLAPRAAAVHCVDASPETVEMNRRRLGAYASRVTYELADVFQWRPARRYDTVFFGFWLSHVPSDRFQAFWGLVADALAPGGRIFLVDSLANPTSTARDHRAPAGQEEVRRLNDGREFTIVKRFYEPADLERRLRRLGWSIEVRATPTYFLWAAGGR